MSLQSLGALLRHYRRSKQQTQEELGGKINYTHSHVSRIEQGERLPTREYLTACSRALGLTDDEQQRLWTLYKQALASSIPPPPFPDENIQSDASKLNVHTSGVPEPLAEWVGRAWLLADLDDKWNEGHARVIGLVGFGGEGKSSLACKWIDHLLSKPEAAEPITVCWWSFYEQPNVESFFEAALTALSRGQIDPRKYPSSTRRAQLIADALILYPWRVILALDGLEVMQNADGDHYGSIWNNDLRELLRLIAGDAHRSLCLVTSRIPLVDLIDCPAYYQLEVDRLNAEEGRALLRNLGVSGDERALDQIISSWDGHALALALLGKYVAEILGGDISKMSEVPPPTAGETRYDRVHRVLRRYDDALPSSHRAFLKIFSAFRAPVPDSAFEKVFRVDTYDPMAMNASLVQLDASAMDKLVKQLLALRILQHSEDHHHFSVHPLIHSHYHSLLDQSDRAPVQQLHSTIKDYYLTLAGTISPNPTLEELSPVIEAVHHACRAGEYQAAYQLCDERIYQGLEGKRVIARELGAYETIVALLTEFFPGGDTSRDPMLADDEPQSWILNEMGLALMLADRTREAMPFFERSRVIYIAMEDWQDVCVSYRNAMDLNFILGNLEACESDAIQSLRFANKSKDQTQILKSLVNRAYIAFYRGDTHTAQAFFQDAENLQREMDPSKKYLVGLLGIRQVEYLLRTDQTSYAREVAEHNLRVCELNHWIPYQSQCRCGLGDLEAHEGKFDSAREHYDAAVKLGATVSHRFAYFEALMARGAFRARYLRDVVSARSDLDEALRFAVQINYRINEPFIHLGFAWAHLAVGELSSARAEAIRSKQIAETIGYIWGQRDADEVLNKIDKQ